MHRVHALRHRVQVSLMLMFDDVNVLEFVKRSLLPNSAVKYGVLLPSGLVFATKLRLGNVSIWQLLKVQ